MKALLLLVALIYSSAISAQDKPEAAPAAPESPPSFTNTYSDERRIRFGVGVGIMLSAPDAEFDKLQYTSTTVSVTGKAKLRYEKVASLILEARMTPRYNWGFIGGLNYEAERELESGTVETEVLVVPINGGSGSSKYNSPLFTVARFIGGIGSIYLSD